MRTRLFRATDRALRVGIGLSSYAAVAASIIRNEEPVDDPASEKTVSLLDNRSRNYSQHPEAVAGFYEKGGSSSTDRDEPSVRSVLKWRGSEGVTKRNIVRCRGTFADMEKNYELLGALGAGAFATVRYCVDRTTGFPRAVKTVRTGHHENVPMDVEWERMLAEVEALMELTHPNIVRLHEYYRDEDALYLVEEYCSGGTLESLMVERGGRISEDEVALLLRQMLRGVLCCHAHGLTHRDLKPDNFVLASKDTAAALKLIDFGLSLGGTWSHVPSEYANMAGTLEYSAPGVSRALIAPDCFGCQPGPDCSGLLRVSAGP